MRGKRIVVVRKRCSELLDIYKDMGRLWYGEGMGR